MRGHLLVGVAVMVAAVGLACFAPFAGAESSTSEVAVVVAPSTLNLDSASTWVTIHVAIPLSIVKSLYVTVDGGSVNWAWVKADAQGELVIKLDSPVVKAAVKPGIVTFRVGGTTSYGTSFYGCDDVRVISCKGT